MTQQDAQRILAGDDKEDSIELLSYNVSRVGLDDRTAADGDEALTLSDLHNCPDTTLQEKA